MLAEFFPESIVLVARNETDALPRALQLLRFLDGGACFTSAGQVSRARDQALLRLDVAGVLGFEPRLEAVGDGVEALLQ